MTLDPKKKSVEILQPQIADTTENWNSRTVPVPENHLAIDITKRIIKVGDGAHPFNTLRNHTHDEQYSTLTHGHYFGYGDKWMRAKPTLWLRSDLANHPELVELNGQYIDDERAATLAELYVSETRISPIATEMSSELYNITASSTSPLCLPYRAFGDTITMNNWLDTQDQWITEHTGEYTEEWIALENKGSTLYSLSAYSMVSRCGTILAPFIPSASPRDWVIEISDDGTVWEIISTVTDAPLWNTNEQRSYELGPVKDTRFMRLRITRWHLPLENEGVQEIGIRRIVFFGKRAGGFALPNIPSLHPSFAWVVPISDIGIGMKHEEVGDIGSTGNMMPLLPKNRILANGQALRIEEYQQLYGCYGQKYALPFNAYTKYETSRGSVELIQDVLVYTLPDGEDLTTETEFTFTSDQRIHPGFITVTFDNQDCLGTTWTLYGKNVDDEWCELFSQKENTTIQIAKHLIHDHAAYQDFRFVVHTWSVDIATKASVEFNMTGTHEGFFHVPELPTEEGISSYIVAQIRTEDINSKVVLDLQNVIADLQKQLATAIKRLSDAEVEIQNLKQG